MEITLNLDFFWQLVRNPYFPIVRQIFIYLIWFLVIFSSTGALFFLTKAPERLKILLAVLIPILILSDIGSAWLIIYHDVYVKVMWLSGFLLAVFFMTMVVFIQRDLWFSKEAARS